MTGWKFVPPWRATGTPPPLRLHEWADQGLCATHGGDWFPDPGRIGPSSRERALCGQCPVRELCLAYALDAGESYGIWGGLDPEERLTLVHRLSGISAPDEVLAEHNPPQAA